MSPIFLVDMDEPVRPSRVWFDATAYQFAGMSVSSATSVAARYDRNAEVVARSGIDQIIVTVYVEGGYRFVAERRETEVKAGDICVLDLARTCLMHGSNNTNLSVVLPRAALEPLVPDIDALHGIILPHGSPLNTLLLSHMRMIYAEAPGLGNSEGVAAARATEGLIAACLGPSAAGREAGRHAVAAVALRKIRRLIEANLGDAELGPDTLCRQGGVSRATLYRLFEPFGGVGAYIRQRRLTRAFRLLSDPVLRAERVKDMAVRCGFTNEAVFSRALRQAYGKSPSDIRAGAGFGHVSQDSGDGTFFALNRWLRGLDTLAH